MVGTLPRQSAVPATARGKDGHSRLGCAAAAWRRKANTAVSRRRSCPCRSRWRKPFRTVSSRRSAASR